MRISELINESIINEITRPDIDQAQEILKKAGYHEIGSGFESLVFQRPGDKYVLKLIDSGATSYFDFINLAKSSKNPHFPVFKGNLMKVTDNYYAIRMEPLSVFTDSKVANLIERYTMKLSKSSSNELSSVEMDELEKSQPEIKDACYLVAKLISEKGYHSDMMTNNFMLRGNTIVFIDPVIQD